MLIQFNAGTAATNGQALRAVLTEFAGRLALRWKQNGFLPPYEAEASGAARNLLGFKDGTANPDISSAYLTNRTVWVGNDPEEPSWTNGGTYCVFRRCRPGIPTLIRASF